MLLTLDGQGPTYRQLMRAIEAAIGNGRLGRGERLPSTRELAADAARLKQVKLARQSGAPAAAATAPTAFNSGAKASTSKPTQAELNAASRTTDWLMPNRDYFGQRYVDLKQINRNNAATLQPIATYQVADNYAFHDNPIVAQGLLYVATDEAKGAILRIGPATGR